MRVHYLQHVIFEGLGSIATWLERRGDQVQSTQFYQSTALPPLDDFDLLIVMGGPMSVNDEEKYPWLRLEKQFIRDAIEAEKAVLGVCLGAQLIASAYGEAIYPNRRKEIGWFPIYNRGPVDGSTFSFPESIEVFHWHGETFDLPEKAKLLASSEACTNQAFQIGRRAIGLQFHLETTEESAMSIVENCREEIATSKFVQPENEILTNNVQRYEDINRIMEEILSYLVRRD